MRALLLGMALMIVTGQARAACQTTEAQAIAWAHAAWFEATYRVYDAGVDTAAIANGLTELTEQRVTPEKRFIVFRSPYRDVVRILLVSQGCFEAYGDVMAKDFDTWIKRSVS